MCGIGRVRNLKVAFMGLDIVEFVMSVEEEFQIEIPNDVPETFINTKTVIDYVHSQVQDKFTREQVAEKIWEILVNETGINRKKFDENSHFIEDMELD
jgi:acyl carrier protein